MCTCGCAQILGECNHVGCPQSTAELGMSCALASPRGKSDKQILDCIRRASTAPWCWPRRTTQGFDLRRMDRALRCLRRRAAGNDSADPPLDHGRLKQQAAIPEQVHRMTAEERERREQIRRETGEMEAFEP